MRALRIRSVFVNDIWFVEGKGRAVSFGDSYYTAGNAHRFARKTNNALYIKYFWIAGVAEDNDIAARRFMEMVGELINDEVVTALECGMHALAFNNEWLCYKKSNGKDDDNGENKEDRNLFQRASEEIHASIVRSLIWRASFHKIRNGVEEIRKGRRDHAAAL